MRNFLFILFTSLLFAGEYHEVNIVEKEPCCECECEIPNSQLEYLWYHDRKELNRKYKFFNGRKHICIVNHTPKHYKDEKGCEITVKYHSDNIHVCTGIWCPRECCFDIDEFLAGRFEEEKYLFPGMNEPHRPYPVIPTPPPVSPDH